MSSRRGAFTLIQQNDTHAQIGTHWEQFRVGGRDMYRRTGGLARAAQVVRAIRRDAVDAFAVDCGDTFYGTLPALRTEGRAVLPALRALGIDLLVPGNWDYGFGPAALRARADELGAAVLAANLLDANTGDAIFPATLVRELGGVRVGFAGVTSPIVPGMSARFAAGLRFPEVRKVLPRAIGTLREDERCDVIVVVSHLGFAQDVALVRELDGIDVVLSGHTHNRLARPVRAGGALIIQSGFSGSFLGLLHLEVERGRIVAWRHELIELAEGIAPDRAVADLVAEAEAPFREEGAAVVGHTAVPLHRMALLETSMDNLIVSAYRELTGAEIALSHGWRFGPPVPAGPVTEADLWAMIPTNPEVFTTRLSGEGLLALIEKSLHDVFAGDALQQAGGYVVRASGLSVTFRPNNGRGTRVEHIDVGGAPLHPARLYTVASAGGRDVPASAVREPTGVSAIEALRQYLHSASPVHPDITHTTFIAQ